MTATRAVIYLRVSLDATGEELTITRHREDCQRIAKVRGWAVVAEYVDNSISAAGKKRRPQYDAMVAAYARGEFDAILCWDLDRLTRVPRQLEDWIDAATERGLLLVTANGEADLSTDAGRLFARIKASVGRNEIERKGARQRSAAAQRAELGRPPKGTRLTGFSVDGKIIRAEAKVVRELFEKFAAGESIKGLTRGLTEAGVPTRRGGAWHPSSVREILTNPRYAGRAVYRGDVNGRTLAGAAGKRPIVRPEVFDVVQDRLADPRRRLNREGTDRKHLGAGLFRCAECDRPCSSFSGQRYRCRDAHVTRARTEIDAFVVRMARGRLAEPDLADLLPRTDSAEVKRLAAEVKRLEGRVARIEADYDAELIDGRRYRVATDKATAELSAARSAYARLAVPGVAAAVLSADDPVAAFDAAPLMIRRAVIEALCVVRIGKAPRGRRTFDPFTLGDSAWTGDTETWADAWRARGFPSR
ncbi:recombinase family protein [Asanoa iriomotensis]|uniref:Serine recombinase n=1 Tax=Asanoa iriomotensis TaxID=234613 RepID=A0ABQ4CBY1_9ACTN|nr:recombinase family protein [Asanoa iriomotensis]GIF59830.1 serine recombinase [Asanoa iriomotensis]